MITTDLYYTKFEEPLKGALLALRTYILHTDPAIREGVRYKIPFFYYKEWRLAFLWVKKKNIILGIISDYRLCPDGSKKDGMRMITIDPNEDFEIEIISRELNKQIALYKEASIQS